ncbi:DNA-binding transcriptional regulator/RsmH inhibitor MraZ [Sphingomonas sp. BE270]|jgi:DNA-binding transcriptional regulator/RsmH inhibitor MraZ|uniref:cell division protein SepF n=2 Tax=Sphingomonas TaxID=13687 RepID=UPI00053EEF51|nr:MULTISPECIES: cell division protein SepF [unclassified Sphingomonas]MDR7256839.1 DNA-binding transcriptional regulator/RsmH inhibitor MraZ [Sphingomonas sp. BE270]
MDELFMGSALCEVTEWGDILLPRRFHQTLRLRSAEHSLFIGLHEESPCLIAFDRLHAMQRQFEVAEKLAASPGGFQDHHRLRRTYGFVDEAPVAPDGMMTLPRIMRERGAIGDFALLVATGARFEIWDMAYVLDHGPSDLVTLATLLRASQIAHEVNDVAVMSPARASGPTLYPAQSGVRVQCLPALQPRHDPVGRRAAHQ